MAAVRLSGDKGMNNSVHGDGMESQEMAESVTRGS